MVLKNTFEFIQIDEDIVAVPIGAETKNKCVLKVNKTAREVLQLLAVDTTEESIIEIMKYRYASEDDGIIETAVRSLIMKLYEENLLKID